MAPGSLKNILFDGDASSRIGCACAGVGVGVGAAGAAEGAAGGASGDLAQGLEKGDAGGGGEVQAPFASNLGNPEAMLLVLLPKAIRQAGGFVAEEKPVIRCKRGIPEILRGFAGEEPDAAGVDPIGLVDGGIVTGDRGHQGRPIGHGAATEGAVALGDT